MRTKERLLEIWLKDGRSEKVTSSVSNKIRQILNLDPESVVLYYKEHQRSIQVRRVYNNFSFRTNPL